MSFFKEFAASAVFVSLFLSFSAHSSVSQDGLWSDLSFRSSSPKEFEYRSLQANTDQLTDQLKNAPIEGSSEPGLELYLPLSSGQFTRVSVYESPVMAPGLAAQFPSIKTYKVFGLDDPLITGRIDIGPLGFHGMLDTAEGSVYIEPESSYKKSASAQQYRSFNKSAFPESAENFKCSVEGHDHKASGFSYLSRSSAKSTVLKSSGTKKRTYRLAVAATSEYTETVSTSGGNGTVAEGQAAIVTAINRINQIYEKEVAVKLELVANNSSVVHLGPTDDGLDNTSASTLIGQIQGKLDSVIGQANYDIGHVFATTPGGVARLGSVCEANNQGKGVTGTNSPVGDPFVVDYVAHEMGHQFGATHSFNAGGSTSGSCDDANRQSHTNLGGGTKLAASAYEPGSGSTIMAYANICDPQNIQSSSDDYFHARSLEQIRDFVDGVVFSDADGSICGVEVNTGDTIPTVEAGNNYTIPGSTPFALTGVGNDVDVADAGTLTYTWEQYDLGSKSTTLAEMHADADTRPLFRSYKGTSSPTRYFPALTAILSGTLDSITGERLPTTDRDMKFRLTVRSGDQGFNQDDMTVTIDKDAGPLLVTAPVAASTFSGASDTVVTWNVANTTAAPVSCANMAISYSTDSGQNFATTLLASTPNDGSQIVTLPNTTTTQGRVKVQCQDNVFFNVSPGDFNVNAIGSLAISALSATKAEGDSSTTAYTFNVVRSGSTIGTASATYTVSGTSANPADVADFGGSFPSATVSFANGESSKTVTINVTGDTAVESDENFAVTLSTPVTVAIGTATANGTIQNDDDALSIVATSAAKAEGDSATTAFTFTVNRTGNTASAVSATYTVSGAAVDTSDFSGGSLPSDTVSFANGETSKLITVNVTGDTAVESDEAFVVTLSAPVGTVIGTASANGTIQNDDDTISIVATSAVKAEGDSSITAFTFTVNRTGNTASAVSATYTVSGAAVDTSDFSGGSLPSGTVSFANGETSKLITVNVTGDTAVESDEAFVVMLSAPVGTVIGTASANGTILNDDDTISIVATSAVKAEGDSATTAFTFTVSRTGNTASTVSASYAVSGAAVNAADFGGSLPSGSVSFANGETSKLITINVSGDTAVESDEAFTVTLSVPVSTVIGTAAANGTIENDDESLSIAATSAVKSEGDSSTTAFTFTVSRTGNTAGTASASYAVSGVAVNAADFGGSLPSGSVSFGAGETNKLITVNVTGDTAVETDEVFTVTLSAPVSTVIGTATANGTIQNDDDTISIVATSAAKAEGDSATTAFTFTVNRTGNTASTVSASYAVSGAAVDTADFSGASLPSGSVSFTAGVTSQVITVNVTGDTAVESDEAFIVTLSAPVGTVIGTAAANGTIENDDASVSITTTPTIKAEGHTGTTQFTFTVTRIVDLSSTASVAYAITGTGANAAVEADFGGSFPTGTVNFSNGVSEQTITVNITADTVVEEDEGFLVTISNPVNTVISNASVTGTIQNDDASVSVAATSADKAEGQSGNAAYTFTVTRTGNTTAAATVNYAVTGSGADAADFVGGAFPSGTASFAGGASSAVITVNVIGETVVESDEGFTLTLNTPSVGTIIGTASANGTIQNDDASVSIAATDAEKAEGQSGNAAYTFTVTRTGNVVAPATVDYAVTGANAADFDGSVLPSGTAAFAGGVSSALITVNVKGDSTVESDEIFTVTLNTPSVGTVIGAASANGTIINDDVSLAITATSADKSEGNTGTTAFTFTVTRTGDEAAAVFVDYVVLGGTGFDSSDYVGAPADSLPFASGVTSRVITLNIAGDTEVEADEAFTVKLMAHSGVGVGFESGTETANGVVRNDDASVSVAALSAVKAEGHTGNTAYTFTATRTGNTTAAATVNYAVTGASAADFVGGTLPSGTANFTAGSSSTLITINVVADTVVESDEGFTLTLNTPSTGMIIATAAVNGTIQNDDASLAIAATSATNAEGHSSTKDFTFTVTRTGDTTGAASVAYAVTGSGANSAGAADFSGTLPSGTLNFAGGSDSEVITIAVSGDTDVELDEGFTVTLSGPSAGAVIATAAANGVIENDDAALVIAATDADKLEGDSSNTAFTFTVTRSGNTTGTASASYAVTGSDVNAADFGGSLPSGTVNFAGGESTKDITINVSGDTDTETVENFVVTLTAPSTGTVISTATATGIIKNDDGPVSYSITALAADQAEGNTGSTAFTFSIVRSGTPGLALEQISYAVTGFGGNAATAADFTGGFAAGQVDFAAGAHTEMLTINVAGDVEFEAAQGFVVTLSSAPAVATISQATAEGVIQNDDAALSIAATSVVKSSNNMYTFTFTVTRTAGAIGTSSVQYAVTGSGANPVVAADFGGSLPAGTVNFAAGQSTAVVSITVSGATTVGSDKTFTVTLSNPVNASVAGVSATGIITNDVTAPAVAASGGGGGGSFGWLMLALLMSFVPLRKQR